MCQVITTGEYWTCKTLHVDLPKVLKPSLKATRLHADGYMSKESIPQSYEALNIEAIKQQCETEVGTEGRSLNVSKISANRSKGFYEAISHFAQYGSGFKRVNRFFRSKNKDGFALIEVNGHHSDWSE